MTYEDYMNCVCDNYNEEEDAAEWEHEAATRHLCENGDCPSLD